MSKWISVKDKLPEMEKPVMVWVKDRLMIAMRDNPEHEGWCWYFAQWAWSLADGDFEMDDHEVTHWMPLPKPPRVKH